MALSTFLFTDGLIIAKQSLLNFFSVNSPHEDLSLSYGLTKLPKM